MATSAKVPRSLKKVNPKIPVFDVKLFLNSIPRVRATFFG
jgi:hypothetical protein